MQFKISINFLPFLFIDEMLLSRIVGLLPFQSLANYGQNGKTISNNLAAQIKTYYLQMTNA